MPIVISTLRHSFSSSFSYSSFLESYRQRCAGWTSKQFLVSYALHHSDSADILYHKMPEIFPAVNADACAADMSAYQQHTLRLIAAYEEERRSSQTEPAG